MESKIQNPKSKILSLAVIGAGALGKHHARILSGMDGVRLAGVADVSAANGREVAQRCGTRWVADYRELLDEIDAAVVAVPTFAHRDIAGECLDRRIPVLVEKPIASSLPESRELASLADARETLLQVGHVERFNPAWTAAAPLIRHPLYFRCERSSPYAFRSMDIGVVHDVLIHDLDLVLATVESPVTRIEAFGSTIVGGHEDCVQARLTFANGCIADLSANRVSPVTTRTMQVWSAESCTGIDFAAREVVHYSRSETLQYGTPLPERAGQPGANLDQLKQDLFGTFIRVHRPAVSAADALTGELSEFVHCVRTGSTPQVGGREAVEVMAVAERILDAAAEHQRRTFPAVPLRRAG